MSVARLRYFAFLPPAVGIASSLLFFASSLVSNLEQIFVADPIPIIGFQRIESGCDPVSRTMQELSRSMMGCEPGLGCGASRFVCPISANHAVDPEPDDPLPQVFVF